MIVGTAEFDLDARAQLSSSVLVHVVDCYTLDKIYLDAGPAGCGGATFGPQQAPALCFRSSGPKIPLQIYYATKAPLSYLIALPVDSRVSIFCTYLGGAESSDTLWP